MTDRNDLLNVVDTSNGLVLQTIPAPGPDQPGLVFSGDGRRIAYMNPQGRLRIVNSRNSRTISEIAIPDDIAMIS